MVSCFGIFHPESNVYMLMALFFQIEIFQDYNDTVIAIGLSHLPRNDSIFSTSDIAVGIDVLTGDYEEEDEKNKRISDSNIRPSELEFVSAMASHSCAFRFRGASSVSHMSTIIERSRAALEAATNAGIFVIAGGVSFALYVLFAACAPATTGPYVPLLGSILYLLLLLPLIGFAMALTDAEPEAMHRVPPKNDQAVTFARREGRRMYAMLLLKGVLPAAFPQLLYLVTLGELLLFREPDLVATMCPGMNSWVQIIRCESLRSYSGVARTSAGALSLASFVFNIAMTSASFLFRFVPIRDVRPWEFNHAWVWSLTLLVVLAVVYIILTVGADVASALPWYFYFVVILTPILSLVCDEYLKQIELRHEIRSEKLRR